MRAIILALGLMVLSHTALGQANSAYVLPGGCGSGSFATGTAQPLTTDATGRLCNTGPATTSTNLSGTIAVTNTFQSIQAANTSNTRKGCLIQNNGSNTMWVFFGPIGSASKGASYQIAPASASAAGQAISCANGAGGVAQDQVSITGTSGDAFTANFN